MIKPLAAAGDDAELPDANLSDEVLDALLADVGPEPRGEAVLAQAALLFRDRFGLPLPPIPADFVPDLRILGPGLVGTRVGAPDPYGLPWFLDELGERPEPYLLLGTAGHGTNSWAMHYYLVLDRLALFLQIGWGGAYQDPAASAARVQAVFAAAETILAHAGAIGQSGLIIVASDTEGGKLGLIGVDGQPALADDPDPLTTALTQLGV